MEGRSVSQAALQSKDGWRREGGLCLWVEGLWRCCLFFHPPPAPQRLQSGWGGVGRDKRWWSRDRFWYNANWKLRCDCWLAGTGLTVRRRSITAPTIGHTNVTSKTRTRGLGSTQVPISSSSRGRSGNEPGRRVLSLTSHWFVSNLSWWQRITSMAVEALRKRREMSLFLQKGNTRSLPPLLSFCSQHTPLAQLHEHQDTRLYTFAPF